MQLTSQGRAEAELTDDRDVYQLRTGDVVRVRAPVDGDGTGVEKVQDLALDALAARLDELCTDEEDEDGDDDDEYGEDDGEEYYDDDDGEGEVCF